MILCASMNPSLDKAATLPRFSPDAPNRIAVERLDVGGKGVNVAKVLRELGADCRLIGFDYAGEPVAQALNRAGVSCDLIPVPGELRVNLKLHETATGRTLEISERGATVPPGTLHQLEETLLSSANPGDWAVLSGSLPPGADSAVYARLCAALKEKGCRVAVDCDGEALRQAIAAKPDLIKPNAQEFSALTGTDASDPAAIFAACQALIENGVGAVCLTLGGDGALLVTSDGAWRCAAAAVEAKGVQGAGDSILAGLVYAWNAGAANPEALRFGAAVAGASVMRPGTLLAQKADVTALLPSIRAERLCSGCLRQPANRDR